MKKTPIFICFILICTFCSSVNAQKLKSFGSKGVWELGGTIFYTSVTPVTNDSSGTAVNVFNIQPVAGYFIAKSIEIGIQPTITITSSNGSSYTTMGLYFAPAYNFIMKSKIYPAIIALLGYTSTSYSPSGG